MLRTSLWLLFPLVLCAACGGDSSFEGDGPPPAASVPLEEVPDGYATATCAVLERCAGVLSDLVFALEDCETLWAETLRQGGFADVERAVGDERVVYHADKAEACFAAIENRDCDELDERDIPECEAALTGTVPEDGECELDAECEGSLICRIEAACPGTCVQRYGAGEDCTNDDECADGLVCSTATARCVTPAAAGEACEGGTEPQCEPGHFCAGSDNAQGTTGTCRAAESIVQGAAGSGCDPTDAELCDEGLSCVVTGMEGTTATWECRAIPASGGTCGLGLPENCPAGEYCPLGPIEILVGMVEGTCRPLPGVGDSCSARPFPFLASCEAYARCEGNECVELRDLGESCTSSTVCYSGYCEDGGCESPRACGS